VDTSFWGQPSTFSRDYDKRTWAEVPLLLLKADQGGLLGRQCDASNADAQAITLTDEEAARMLPESLWDELGVHYTAPKFDRMLAATMDRYLATLPYEPMCPGNLFRFVPRELLLPYFAGLV